MPLLQESTTKREIISGQKINVVDDKELPNNASPSTYVPYGNSTMLSPTQLFMASQFMASVSTMNISDPAFYQRFLAMAAYHASSPSPPAATTTDLLSPILTTTKTTNNNNNNNTNNNNNNTVTSSTTMEIKKRKCKDKEELVSLPSPTSSISPSSGVEVKDLSRDKQFTCGVCKRSFGYKHVLQNHERTHTGEKPFECQECHKRFTRDHHLKTHMRLHTGERPYQCEYCDRKFVQVANLRRHSRVHTGERPYSCEHCSAKFSDSNQLKAHVLIHTDEKPFSCEKCQSRFRRRHHLLHHKCGVSKVTFTEPEETEDNATRRRVLHPPSSPLIAFPLQVALPEQTEPEDLSTKGFNSNNSIGGSPARSRSSRGDTEDDDDLESNYSGSFHTKKMTNQA